MLNTPAGKKLLAKAKQQGYLNIEDFSEAIPDDASAESIEEIMTSLSDLGIQIRDEEETEYTTVPNRVLQSSKPEIKNPFSHQHRSKLLSLSRFTKEQDLLKPHQRRYLYFGGKYDFWFKEQPSKLSQALDDLTIQLAKRNANETDIEHVGDIRTQLNYYRSEIAANHGDPYAQDNCGDYWFWGLHAPPDLDKAISWYKLAANHGDRDIQVKLGRAYYENENYDLAKTTLEDPANQGDPEAQCIMGVLHDDDVVKADWFEKAAKQGWAEAQYSLGHSYQYGNGRSQDLEKAAIWIEKAAEQGEVIAQRVLGDCYNYGEGVEENKEKALEYYRLAADSKDPIAQYRLGYAYYYGEGVEEDDTEAAKWFEAALSRVKVDPVLDGWGDEGNCYALLGHMHLLGHGVQVDERRAVDLLTKGSDLDDGVAHYYLGMCYRDGTGLAKNPEKAENLIKAAAENDVQPAIEALVEMYQGGHEIAEDLKKALYWQNKLEEPQDEEEKYERAVKLQNLTEELKAAPGSKAERLTSSSNVYLFPELKGRPTIPEDVLSQIEERDPEGTDIQTLIDDRENGNLEFKSSARYDFKTGGDNTDLEFSIIKTVAGFLNAFGGTLIIGVSDDKDETGERRVLGLEKDYGLFEENNRNSDAYERYLRTLLENALPDTRPLTTDSLTIRFPQVSNCEVCQIDVNPFGKPVVVELKSKRWSTEKRQSVGQILFVRRGNSTEQYSMTDAARWIMDHWL